VKSEQFVLCGNSGFWDRDCQTSDMSSTGVLLKTLNHMCRKVAVEVMDIVRTGHATEAMKRYCENMSEVRRVSLMR